MRARSTRGALLWMLGLAAVAPGFACGGTTTSPASDAGSAVRDASADGARRDGSGADARTDARATDATFHDAADASSSDAQGKTDAKEDASSGKDARPDTRDEDAAHDGGHHDAHDDARPDGPPGHDAQADAAHDSGTPGDAHDTDAMEEDSGTDAGIGYTCSGATPSFATDVQPLVTNCGSELCHGGLIRPGDGGPPPDFPYDALVNAPVEKSQDLCHRHMVRVFPGNLEKSYLLNKLTGVGMCPNTVRMPKLGHPLSKRHIQTIVDWICTGALNN